MSAINNNALALQAARRTVTYLHRQSPGGVFMCCLHRIVSQLEWKVIKTRHSFLKLSTDRTVADLGKIWGEIYYALYIFAVLDFRYIVAIQKSKRRQRNGDALVDNSAFWSACKIHWCDRSNDAWSYQARRVWYTFGRESTQPAWRSNVLN